MRPERNDYPYGAEISPRRRALDAALISTLSLARQSLAGHWLFLVNGTVGLYVGLALLSPLLIAAGQDEGGRFLFAAYAIACHQEPGRSFFLAGHQVAFCERDVAIYGSMFLAGLFYAGRRRTRPLRWWWYLLALVPMAIDGGSQLVGWRESTWQLRLFTGTLFGLATVWFLYPHLDRTVDELRNEDLAAAGGRLPEVR
ncbi:MAG: DUF2085 domain-containing protein [Chloroflexota bacterium]